MRRSAREAREEKAPPGETEGWTGNHCSLMRATMEFALCSQAGVCLRGMWPRETQDTQRPSLVFMGTQNGYVYPHRKEERKKNHAILVICCPNATTCGRLITMNILP